MAGIKKLTKAKKSKPNKATLKRSRRPVRRKVSTIFKSKVFKVSETKVLAVSHYKNKAYLLIEKNYRGQPKLALLSSSNGSKFSKTPSYLTLKALNKKEEDLKLCHDFRLSHTQGEMVLTYLKKSGSSQVIAYATTKNRKTWSVKKEIKGVNQPGFLALAAKKKEKKVIYSGGDFLRLAAFTDKEGARISRWEDSSLRDFFHGQPMTVFGLAEANKGTVVFCGGQVKVDLLEDVNLSNHKVGERTFLKIGAILFDKNDLTKTLWQTELPLVELDLPEQDLIRPLGLAPLKAKGWRFYFLSAGNKLKFFEFNEALLEDHYVRPVVQLIKSEKNPIVGPSGQDWEEGGTFNPAAVHLGGRTHLLYRAVGNDGYSRIGYVSSTDGVNIDERLSRPIYSAIEKDGREGEAVGYDEVVFGSGGSWGGCEDPKVTLIDDRLYMTYVAHNGYWPMRTAITSIAVDDFLNKIFRWRKPKLMSPPSVGSKSVVILPEKINGQYVIFHRLWPNIVVDFVPSLEFGEGNWLKGEYKILPRASYWDSQKMSMGAAPIKTKKGWLAIYNAVDRRDSSRYKIGAMLLSAKDPRQVVTRSRRPILSPDEWYENAGKPGIAYPGGVVERDGKLYVYYGGADRVSCVATIPTDELLWHLEKDKEPILKVSTVDF